jgi:hypothetical protein
MKWRINLKLKRNEEIKTITLLPLSGGWQKSETSNERE